MFKKAKAITKKTKKAIKQKTFLKTTRKKKTHNTRITTYKKPVRLSITNAKNIDEKKLIRQTYKKKQLL